MASVSGRTTAFYAWEAEGRGRRVHPHPVALEPPFRPFRGHVDETAEPIDDARKPTWLSGLVNSGRRPAEVRPPPAAEAPDPKPFERDGPLYEMDVLVPVAEKIDLEASATWLRTAAGHGGPISFELVASGGHVTLRLAAGERDAGRLRDQTVGLFPNINVRPASTPLAAFWMGCEGDTTAAAEFVLAREFMIPLDQPSGRNDVLIPLLATLARVEGREVAIVQVLYEPVVSPWGPHALAAVTTPYGEPFFADAPEITKLAQEKCGEPWWAVAIRVIARVSDRAKAEDVMLGITGALSTLGSPGRNELEGIRPADFEGLIEDVLERRTHRSGMLLSLSDLSSLVHMPTPTVRAECLVRPSVRTKAAPLSSRRGPFVLGTNEHDGEEVAVGLSVDQRLRHTYLIGASGTGKSTLLLSMIMQDIAAGNGFGVLDPHGDLIDDVLARIPEERAKDVVLLDPADEEYPVGFNILAAHSELERALLSSDLVAVFRRLSTSFGDQMATVLGNAIVAFLESSEGGTLIDLRRFLLDKSYRAEFLETVKDPEVSAYWQQEFPLLKGLPYAPILTRLNAFFRPKVLRYMIAQKNDRFDMRAIMDGRKILLAKLSHGAIGEENAHLLGSLLVAKVAQAAMSRQNEGASKRIPWFFYADEFHHFVTPSMASILSGARKYALGLTLAHQESRQLKSRSEDVASAVLANAYTRIVFRVGEHDAKTLADGFSFFEPPDLQSLGVGEAIARVERRDHDFNLRTSEPEHVQAELGARRRAAIIAASRAGFGSPRAEVERVLAQMRRDVAAPASAPAPRAVRTPRHRAEPAPRAEPPGVRGRGGPQHKYLQSLVQRFAEDRGFSAEIEKRMLDGHGHVDVWLRRGELAIGVEISVTTDAAHEVDNLGKCLAAGCEYAVLVSTDEATLNAARSMIEGPNLRRSRFLTPDGLIEFLDALDAPARRSTKPSTPRRLAEDATKNAKGIANAADRTMLLTKDAAAYVGLAQQTLAKMRWSGESPPYFKVGRQVVYDRADLDAWLLQRRRKSTSDSGGGFDRGSV